MSKFQQDIETLKNEIKVLQKEYINAQLEDIKIHLHNIQIRDFDKTIDYMKLSHALWVARLFNCDKETYNLGIKGNLLYYIVMDKQYNLAVITVASINKEEKDENAAATNTSLESFSRYDGLTYRVFYDNNEWVVTCQLDSMPYPKVIARCSLKEIAVKTFGIHRDSIISFIDQGEQWTAEIKIK